MRQRGFTFGIQKGILSLMVVLLLATPIVPVIAQTGPPDDGSRSGQFPNNPVSGPDDGFRGSGTSGNGSIFEPVQPANNEVPGDGANAETIDAFGGAGGDASAIQNGTQTVNGSSITQTTSITSDPENFINKWIYNLSISLSGFMISIGAYVFDTAFNSFVVKLSCWFVIGCTGEGDLLTGQGQVGGVVNELWKMVRDLFNIAFIFALIYIGIRTILFTEDSSTRKMLGMLIIAALLINFSLYIAKVIVDIANFTAVAVYQNLEDGLVNFSLTNSTTNQVVISTNESLAGSIMSILKFTSFFQVQVADLGSMLLYALMLLIFSAILTFTFLYAGVMLLFRFIAIVFYLIFSPLMFLAWVVPQFGSVGKQWWNGFLGYAFYAPVFVFLIYLSLYVLSAFGASFTSTGFGAAFTGGIMSSFVFFFIAIAFVVTATKVADTIAKQSGAIGMNSASKWGRAATIGVGAYAGGRMASSAIGGLGSGIESVSNRVPGGLGGSHLRSLGSSLQNKKIGGASSYAERQKATREHNSKRTQNRLDENIRSTITIGAAAGATAPQRTAMEAALRDASPSQIVALAQSGSGITALEAAARTGSIPQNKIDAVINSKDVDETDRQRLRAASQQGVRARMNSNPNGVASLASGDLSSLDFETDLLPNAMDLSSAQMQSLRTAWQQNQTQTLQRLETERTNQFNDALQHQRYVDIVNNRNDSEIAQLPNNVISDPGFVTYLAQNNRITNRMLTQIATRQGNVDTRAIGRTLLLYYTTQGNPTAPADVENFFNSPMGGQFQ